MKTIELIAPCHFGLEAVLKKEIYDLGYEISQVEDGRVTFIGDEEAICRANVMFVIKKLSNSSNAPFRKTNKFLGAVFGMLKALILVFAIAKIGSFFTENLKSVDNEFLHQLASSGIIEFVNNFNPIDF